MCSFSGIQRAPIRTGGSKRHTHREIILFLNKTYDERLGTASQCTTALSETIPFIQDCVFGDHVGLGYGGAVLPALLLSSIFVQCQAALVLVP